MTFSNSTRMLWAVMAAGFFFLAAVLTWESVRGAANLSPGRGISEVQALGIS